MAESIDLPKPNPPQIAVHLDALLSTKGYQ
jgi:hypothetical protein